MPRHEFRTIEAFVQWLDKSKEYNEQKAGETQDKELRTAYTHAAFAYQHVADVVRNSNLGIVYPPAEQGDAKISFTEEEVKELKDVLDNEPTWNDTLESIEKKLKAVYS